ncbi:MAG: Rho termination factor N-terminal domain-containing protein, partial [Xanthomonadaceae bacterium]|nr:Rho termination factor N-terminal domain-containing protein [Xanthomonadaceae bacterium]
MQIGACAADRMHCPFRAEHALTLDEIKAYRSMNLTDLKKKSVQDLIEMATELGIENIGRSRKQDVIFAILKARARKK